MEMLTYLSASSIQLTLSTYDAISELDISIGCMSFVGVVDDGE